MPGSTRYCRTNSMFGKPFLYDINQSSLSTQRSSFHTLRPFLPNTASSDVSRHFSLEGAKNSGRQTAHQLWSEDIACILQGTCLPGVPNTAGRTPCLASWRWPMWPKGLVGVPIVQVLHLMVSGLDVKSLLKMLHFGEDIISSKLAAGASTFVVAYGVHKVFAPVRIAVTLTCTPFIVRYLRSVGFLKLKKAAKS
ncbi:hypothetical protein BSL78_23717 [Apostichopus japonicus]|uniref:DUF1279 domain-containing protein n=1 Tax=Stichopus japonicus TaxID=307972 RepID=A0A2G8JUM1_STIJA|nr:hypothetical protein BSL78_23717 [Apostichopus japonicus]